MEEGEMCRSSGRMWTVLADVKAARDVEDDESDADGDESAVSVRIYVSGRERRVAWFLYDGIGLSLIFLSVV